MSGLRAAAATRAGGDAAQPRCRAPAALRSSSRSVLPFFVCCSLSVARFARRHPGQPAEPRVVREAPGRRVPGLAVFARALRFISFPAWTKCSLARDPQVDLRCHGASTLTDAPRPNTVAAAADDVLRLLNSLRLYPHALIGHSFGGKVAMGMVHAFGRQLPRPIQVWVLDTVPGDVFADGGDHPRDVIRFVGAMPLPIASRKALIDALTGAGFTPEGAAWMTTNLVATPKGLRWVFDLPGVAEMYTDYTDFNLWPLVEAPPLGARVDFVRAERSAFKWSAEDLERLERAGARVHLLENSSHWCHIDNPEGLMHILSTSLTEMQNGRSAG